MFLLDDMPNFNRRLPRTAPSTIGTGCTSFVFCYYGARYGCEYCAVRCRLGSKANFPLFQDEHYVSASVDTVAPDHEVSGFPENLCVSRRLPTNNVQVTSLAPISVPEDAQNISVMVVSPTTEQPSATEVCAIQFFPPARPVPTPTCIGRAHPHHICTNPRFGDGDNCS